MGHTIGRALRQFRETQEKLTAVVQTEVVDPMAAAAKKPMTSDAAASSHDDEDADAPASATEPHARRLSPSVALVWLRSARSRRLPKRQPKRMPTQLLTIPLLPLPPSRAAQRDQGGDGRGVRAVDYRGPLRPPSPASARLPRRLRRRTIPPHPPTLRREVSSNAHRTRAHAAHGSSW